MNIYCIQYYLYPENLYKDEIERTSGMVTWAESNGVHYTFYMHLQKPEANKILIKFKSDIGSP